MPILQKYDEKAIALSEQISKFGKQMKRGKHSISVTFEQNVEHDGNVYLVAGEARVVCNYQPGRLNCHPDDAYPDESEAEIESTKGLTATDTQGDEAYPSLLAKLVELLNEDAIIEAAWKIAEDEESSDD